ncbi:MAG TPA: LON peptidase substrate-binding domain-containing protein [Actinomycetota bacterium]|nr:LON peptidase substrate-binding domain-containing protein [Actinomycetota bacterium]
MPDIGLFPLGLALLPGERLPLHIFEPRYKELINECIDTASEFGIILLDSRGIRDVGTRAAVAEVLERYDDGRMDIVVEGSQRFRLLEIKAERSFLTAEVEPLLDSTALPDRDVYEESLREYRRVMTAAGVDLEEPVPDRLGLAFHLAARFRMGVDRKQELLEMRSEVQRLERIKELLEASAALIRRQRIEKSAATNGRADRLGPLGPLP